MISQAGILESGCGNACLSYQCHGLWSRRGHYDCIIPIAGDPSLITDKEGAGVEVSAIDNEETGVAAGNGARFLEGAYDTTLDLGERPPFVAGKGEAQVGHVAESLSARSENADCFHLAAKLAHHDFFRSSI